MSIEVNPFGIKACNACNIDRSIQHLSSGKKFLFNFTRFLDP
jgi:hypothetical protein